MADGSRIVNLPRPQTEKRQQLRVHRNGKWLCVRSVHGRGLDGNQFTLLFPTPYRKYRLISVPIHFPTGTETPFPIIR